MTSERLIFPDNVADWPVKIGPSRQLFVDDYLVAFTKGLTRRFHQPSKYAANPLIRTDRSWERESGGTGSGCVVRDERTGRFRMWYNAGKRAMLYAESDDGLEWRKPELGLVDYQGSTRNNILLEGGYLAGLVTDERAPGRRGRYMAFVWRGPPSAARRGVYLNFSDDGIHWTAQLDRCVLAPTENPLLPAVGVGDTSLFRYDTLLGRYVCDQKFNPYFSESTLKTIGFKPDDKTRIRCRTMSESDDLVHWTRPRFIFFPDDLDEPDAQMYSHIGFTYESMWLGMLRVMHIARTGWKQVEIELTYSRDGYHWSRKADRRPFIPLGPPESWEPDYSDPVHNGPLLVGDELWFYYRGSRSSLRDRTDRYESAVGLAKLRRDGFASLEAGDSPGRVVTRPLTFAGRTLRVNAEIESGGWLKAAILTEDSRPVTSLGLEDSSPLTQSTLAGRMTWRRSENIAIRDGEHVRLLFELKEARLYSFWIE